MEFPESVLGAVGWLVGGLGIFLFGIHMLSVGVRDAAGEGMRRVIAQVTRFPPVGLLVGAFLTMLMQSSSAFSVMTVSFVQAGLVTFRQSIPLILGSAIGSTATAQLLSKVVGTNVLESFSLPMVGVGLLMLLFGHRRRTVQGGKILFGFGAVFLGFIFMQGAVAHWQETVVSDAFSHFAKPGILPMVLGLLTGLVVTAIVQSSGATIGILQGLAAAGVVPGLAVAIPIVIGCQVGTAITGVIAAIGTSADAKRVAGLNVVYRLLGGALALAAMPLFLRWVPLTAQDTHAQIANFHTIQSIVIALLFLPLARPLAGLLKWMIRDGGQVSAAPENLDYTGRSTLVERGQQARLELMRLLGVVSTMPQRAVESLLQNDEGERRRVLQEEETVDALDETLRDFLIALERDALAADGGLVGTGTLPDGMRVAGIHTLQALHHVERVADHAENIAELRRFDRPFIEEAGEAAGEELLEFATRVGRLATQVARCLEDGRESDLVAIATYRAAFRRECAHRIAALHLEVSNADQQPVVALIVEEIVVNLESSANHLRKAANAYFGRPMQPTHLDAEE
jgi:phosphate:Na+ symporter